VQKIIENLVKKPQGEKMSYDTDATDESDDIDDPLFSPRKKKIKIQDFLVLEKQEESGSTKYVIKSFGYSKKEALTALSFLKDSIASFNKLSPLQKIEFCQSQRALIKLYLKLLNQKKSIIE